MAYLLENRDSKENPLSFRKGFSWAFAGRFVYAFSQWGILIILTKATSVFMVGQFGLALAVTAPVYAITDCGLRALIATDAEGRFEYGIYLALRLISVSLSLLIIFMMVFIGNFSQDAQFIIVAIGLAKAFESIDEIFYGISQKYERMDLVAKSLIIKAVLTLLGVGTLVYFTHSLLVGISAMIVFWALMLLLYDLPNARLLISNKAQALKLRPIWIRSSVIRLACLALPLGVMAMLISLNYNIPRYFIAFYQGEEALGYYTAIGYLMVAGTMVSAAMQNVASPRLAESYANNQRQFVSLLIKLLLITFALGGGMVLLGWLGGEWFLRVFYGSDYAQYASFLVVLFCAGVAMSMFAVVASAMTAMRLIRGLALVTAIGLVLNLFLCWALIPGQGVLGAAFAQVASAAANLSIGIMAIVAGLYKAKFIMYLDNISIAQ